MVRLATLNDIDDIKISLINILKRFKSISYIGFSEDKLF